MKILIYCRLAESHYQQIRDAAPGHEVVIASTREDLIREILGAEVLFDGCSPEAFAHARQLKWFQSSSAGQDGILFKELIESDVIVTNAAGIYASQAAEHAFALLLGLTRGIHRFARSYTDRRRPTQVAPKEIAGWTLGIIGMGGFGVEMAKRARGFELRVIAVDPYRSDRPEFVDTLWGMDGLEDMLRQSDVVMVACPLTAETRHLLNRERIGLMKPTAYLINVARGPIIDEAALIEILKAGGLAGAGLDVYEVEPLPSDSGLWDLDNVILTSHIAGSSQHRPGRTVDFFCDNLRRYLSGQPLLKIVDKRKGF